MSLTNSEGGWHSTALSYGVRSIVETDVAVLERFIKEYERIRWMEDEKERRVEEVEWIVRLVEYPLTCWDGAFELNAGRYLPVGSSTWENYARDLTPEQWERLTVVLLSKDALHGDLLELLRDRRDPRLLEWYLNRIEALAEDTPWNLYNHLHWFCGILKDESLKEWTVATWNIRTYLDQEFEVGGYFKGTDEAEATAVREFVMRARKDLFPR